MKNKFCWRLIFKYLIIYKPSLGSCEVPHKIWARSVRPFLRLFDTNKQAPIRTSNVYIYQVFRALRAHLIFQLLIVASLCTVYKKQTDRQAKYINRFKSSKKSHPFWITLYNCIRLAQERPKFLFCFYSKLCFYFFSTCIWKPTIFNKKLIHPLHLMFKRVAFRNECSCIS